MKFYIVTPSIELIELDTGMLGKVLPLGFFQIVHAENENPPMRRREISKEFLIENLRSTKPYFRLRFDDISAAYDSIKQDYIESDCIQKI